MINSTLRARKDEQEQMAAAILKGDVAQAEKLVSDSAQMHGERLVKVLQAQGEALEA